MQFLNKFRHIFSCKNHYRETYCPTYLMSCVDNSGSSARIFR